MWCYIYFVFVVNSPEFNTGPHILPLSELIPQRQNCRTIKATDQFGLTIVQPGTGYSKPSSPVAVPDSVRRPPAVQHLLEMSQTHVAPAPSAPAAPPRLPPAFHGEQTSVYVSTVLVNHKVAKLKAELLSIAYVFPTTHLRWKALRPERALPRPIRDETDGEAKADAEGGSSDGAAPAPAPVATSDGAAPAPAPVATSDGAAPAPAPADTSDGAAPAPAPADTPSDTGNSSKEPVVATSRDTEAETTGDETGHASGSEAEAEAEAESDDDEEEEEEVPSGLYPGNFDEFLNCVQAAEGPSALMRCVLMLEDVLPEVALVGFNPRLLPGLGAGADTGVSTAAVGVRIFALDRSLKYEDCMLDLRVVGKFAPRTQFVPKCVFTAGCMKPWCHQGRCGVPPRQDQQAVADAFSRYEPIPEVAIHPSRVSMALVYPRSQMVGSHVTEARQQTNDRRQSRGERDAGPRVLVPGSNYFSNLEKMKILASQQEQTKRRGYLNSDSEDEMEESDEESEADEESDDEGGRRLTRFDVDHDDINPAPPRAELIMRSAWV